jgi:hypothetical protein
VSFLNQLKSQAKALQSQQTHEQADLEQNCVQTESACRIVPDHDKATVAFRVMNASGFGILNKTMAASALKADVLDELAKLIVSEPNRFA